MTLDPSELRRAKLKWQQIEKQRQDPRFVQVVGRLVTARLLRANHPVASVRGPVTLEAALWAGEIEPRILELLPAILLKKPGFFTVNDRVPEDLKEVLAAIRKGDMPPPFRGIPGESLLKWVPLIGHQNKLPTLSKTYRFQQEDLQLLMHLKDSLGVSETDVVRLGLKALVQAYPAVLSNDDVDLARGRRARARARRNNFPGSVVEAGEEKPPLYLDLSLIERIAQLTALNARNAALSGCVPSNIPRSQWPGEIFQIGKSSNQTR